MIIGGYAGDLIRFGILSKDLARMRRSIRDISCSPQRKENAGTSHHPKSGNTRINLSQFETAKLVFEPTFFLQTFHHCWLAVMFDLHLLDWQDLGPHLNTRVKVDGGHVADTSC